MKAKGFGDDYHRKLRYFSKDKSTVKMVLFTTTKYPTPTGRFGSNIEKATKVQAPFEWNEKLQLQVNPGSSSVKELTEATIPEILAESNLQKFYTVVGKLYRETVQRSETRKTELKRKMSSLRRTTKSKSGYGMNSLMKLKMAVVIP